MVINDSNSFLAVVLRIYNNTSMHDKEQNGCSTSAYSQLGIDDRVEYIAGISTGFLHHQ